MHTLTNWKAVRSGPRLTVHGLDADGKPVKLAAVEIRGPGSYVCAPSETIAVQPNGDCVILKSGK